MHAQIEWRNELIKVARRPKTGWDSVADLLLRARDEDARVYLRESATDTYIVLRFPGSTKQLAPEIREAHSCLGIDLKDVFSEVLAKRPPKGSSTLWSDLVRAGYKAYHEAWLRFQQLLYIGHSHASTDELYAQLLDRLRAYTKLLPGRREFLEHEKRSRRRRFKQLTAVCEGIHKTVVDRAKQKKSRIRKAVFDKIRGSRIDDLVLRTDGNAAFWRIPYEGYKGKGRPILHDATSWKPHQLAIALLSCERGCAYQTIEKETAVTRRSAKSDQE